MFRTEKKYYIRAFVTALLMGVVLLLPFVLIDGGYFVYYGDYNAQQIPFYKVCISAVQSGNFGWNWQTDLGANFIGSYSFYTLGSPFFWLAALFPVSWSQYFMAPLLALKLGLASLFAFMYIRRFVSKPQTALIGGILYAFSGYSLYNIFFNHFHEAIVFFPLLLIGLEEAVVNKRRGLFALAVALNAFVNYFFFIGECIFLVIYFVIRLCMDKGFRVNVGGFICLAFESVAGVLLAGVLFVPSIYQVLDVPRSTNILTDWNFLFYGSVQRYGLILEGILFPPEVPARNLMFPNAAGKWSSVALYLPLFSMAGVIAFVKGAKGHWARVLLPVCLFMAMVPGLNASFTLFNNNFYTRWFYMPELICCLATVYALERELDIKQGLKACAVGAGVMAGLALLAPFAKTENAEDAESRRILPRFLADMSPAVYVSVALCAGFLVMLWFVLRTRKRLSAEEFMSRTTAAAIIGSLMLGYYFVGYGRILGPYIRDYNKTVSADIRINDIDFYRMEGIDEINNVNMLWGMSSLKSFTSIIPSSTFELYDLVGLERSVNSAPETTRYALRALTRVKYIMIPEDMEEQDKKATLDELAIYEYKETQDGYEIYETPYALPMGFAYDSYVTQKQAKSSSAPDKLMIRAAVLDEETAQEYADIVSPLDGALVNVTTLSQFREDAQQRIDMGISSFGVSRSGFSAVSGYDRDRLVAFSVPFDSGWSAQIDGADVDIAKVNGGLMGLRVPAGTHEIVFTYTTPGLKLGWICTAAGAVMIGVYMLVWYAVLKKRGDPNAHLYRLDIAGGVKAHSSYIGQLSAQIYNTTDKGAVKSRKSEPIEWPEADLIFLDRSRYDFSKQKPKKRTSHITEDDEAYNVLKELERKKRDDEDDRLV